MNHKTSAKRGRTANVGLRRHRTAVRHPERGTITMHSIMKVECVAQRFLAAGSVVLAEVPFADGTGRKWRPAVVVRVVGHVVTLIACTSSAGARATSDVDISNLAAAGLARATKARTGRYVEVDRTRIVKVSGHLSDFDARRILPGFGQAA